MHTVITQRRGAAGEATGFEPGFIALYSMRCLVCHTHFVMPWASFCFSLLTPVRVGPARWGLLACGASARSLQAGLGLARGPVRCHDCRYSSFMYLYKIDCFTGSTRFSFPLVICSTALEQQPTLYPILRIEAPSTSTLHLRSEFWHGNSSFGSAEPLLRRHWQFSELIWQSTAASDMALNAGRRR